jgi:hypothetical protein
MLTIEPPSADPPRRPWDWSHIAALLVCVLVGLSFALLPHFVWWGRLGAPKYFADNDDLLYLAIAGRAFHGHPLTLSDPSTVSGAATIYDWLQFVPGILVTRLARSDALEVNAAWRFLAGLTLPLAWVLLLSRFHRQAWIWAMLTVWILADSGFFSARPLLKQLGVTAYWLSGQSGMVLDAVTGERSADIFRTAPAIHRQWRIITPALSHAWLIMALFLWVRARDRSSWQRILLSGLGFGALFYVYFYNWTALGLALVLATVSDRGQRGVALATGALGLLVGLPRVWERYQIKISTSPDWLIRSDLFRPVSRTYDLMFPKLAIALLVLSAFWVWMRRKDLVPIWLLALASFLLLNHQLVSGLQIQNSHWMNVLGSSVSLLVVLFVGERLARVRQRAAIWCLGACCLAYVSLGLVLRWVEAAHSGDTEALAAQYEHYQAQQTAAGPLRLEPLQCLAGDEAFVNFATVAENQRPLIHYAVRLSPSVDDSQLLERIALNEYLLGADRADFDRTSRQFLHTMPWGPWAKDTEARGVRLERYLAAFDRVRADPDTALDRYGVRYVALSRESPAPATKRWKLMQRGPYWNIWERSARGSEAP